MCNSAVSGLNAKAGRGSSTSRKAKVLRLKAPDQKENPSSSNPTQRSSSPPSKRSSPTPTESPAKSSTSPAAKSPSAIGSSPKSPKVGVLKGTYSDFQKAVR